MNIQTIITDLKNEQDRLARAIAVLEGTESAPAKTARAAANHAARKHKGGGLTPEGRQRLSDLMKKRWAEKRKKKGSKS